MLGVGSCSGISGASGGQYFISAASNAALGQCIQRIQQIIDQAELNSTREASNKLPVVTKLYNLSMSQIRERRIPDAIQTLAKCDAAPLIVVLTLQQDASSENLAWAMEIAAKQKDPEDQIFIYKQMLSLFPDMLDVYPHLIALIDNSEEKIKLFLEVAEQAHQAGQLKLEAFYRKEVIRAGLPTVISKMEWADPSTLILPPYPPALQKFLGGDCTVWKGRKRSETHIVVPCFPQANTTGSPEPFTLRSLYEFDTNSGGAGISFGSNAYSYGLRGDIPAEAEFFYGVLTYDVIPGTKNKNIEEQIRLLPPGYEVPGALNASRAILWAIRHNRKQYFYDNLASAGAHSTTSTRCKELQNSVAVGDFTSFGFASASSSAVMR